MALIKIGTHFREKKLNPILKQWKKSGYSLIWKKRYEQDMALIRPKDITKNKYIHGHFRKYKRRYYDVYTKSKRNWKNGSEKR